MHSFVITAFDEMTPRRGNGQRILNCIRPAQSHPQIDEIVIVDDGSEDYSSLQELLEGQEKVRLCRNQTNRGVFGNKLEAIAQASHDWVITCDSDNTMSVQYLNKITSMPKNWQTWYCPSFAKPRFDYRCLAGKYDLKGLSRVIDNQIFRCFFNTGNQVVQQIAFMQVFAKYRDKRADLLMPNYLNIPEEKRETHYWRMVFDACDSFIFNMEWVFSGNQLAIVSGLEYDHRYATGDEGNYARSPDEKAQLGEILVTLLRSRIERDNL